MVAAETFQYRHGELHCEGVPASGIAEEWGTPCYVYSASSLRQRFRRIRDAFGRWDPLVCFSVKACGNISILRLLAAEGSGFDIVSGGELYRVLTAGGDPAKVVFAGVGKTAEEIEYALQEGIYMFDVESRPELRQIADIAARMEVTARVAIRINPDVDAGTHEKTTTGKGGTKFGIGTVEAEKLVREASEWQGVQVSGVHMHLGSPIATTEPYQRALETVLPLIERLRQAGCRLDHLNIGGGYCISTTGEEVVGPDDYASAVHSYLEKSGCRVIIEPGRYIAGNSAVLLSRMIYRKDTQYGKQFVICDAAMNDLIRPTLYGAFHRIWPVRSPGGVPEVIEPGQTEHEGFDTEMVDVVGPVCETGDFLAKDRPLPPMRSGEMLAVFGAGAYGFTMSSNYNGRPRPPEVLVDGDRSRLIRRRETYEDLVEPEKPFCT
ncbi:MAG: diaminopimelate decarboxylase [Candidatus Brocadiia bacterium]